MNKFFRKVAAAWSKVPAALKSEGGHVALTFAVTFAATAAPAVPALLDNLQVGKFPDLSVVKAVVVAAAAASLKASIPVVRAAVVALVSKFIASRSSHKQAQLAKAVSEYLTIKAAVESAAAQQFVPVTNPAPVPVNPVLNAPSPVQP